MDQITQSIKGSVGYNVFKFGGGTIFSIGDRHIPFYDTTSRRCDHNLTPVDTGESVLVSYLIAKKLEKNSLEGVETVLYVENSLSAVPYIPEYTAAQKVNYYDLPYLWSILLEIKKLAVILFRQTCNNSVQVKSLDHKKIRYPILETEVSVDVTCES